MSKRKKCKLCKVKRRVWEEENFFGVECNKHFVPLVVLEEHRNKLTVNEKETLTRLIKKHYPGWYSDTTILDSDVHWHVHLTRKRKNLDP